MAKFQVSIILVLCLICNLTVFSQEKNEIKDIGLRSSFKRLKSLESEKEKLVALNSLLDNVEGQISEKSKWQTGVEVATTASFVVGVAKMFSDTMISGKKNLAGELLTATVIFVIADIWLGRQKTKKIKEYKNQAELIQGKIKAIDERYDASFESLINYVSVKYGDSSSKEDVLDTIKELVVLKNRMSSNNERLEMLNTSYIELEEAVKVSNGGQYVKIGAGAAILIGGVLSSRGSGGEALIKGGALTFVLSYLFHAAQGDKLFNIPSESVDDIKEIIDEHKAEQDRVSKRAFELIKELNAI